MRFDYESRISFPKILLYISLRIVFLESECVELSNKQHCARGRGNFNAIIYGLHASGIRSRTVEPEILAMWSSSVCNFRVFDSLHKRNVSATFVK